MIPTDWKVATNSSGIRATRARESCARYTAASAGQQPRARPEPGHGTDAVLGVHGPVLVRTGCAGQDLGGYDTHVERLLFASAVVLYLFRTAAGARTLMP